MIRTSGSVGGVRPCQGRGRGFESRLVLYIILAEACKIKASVFLFICVLKTLEDTILKYLFQIAYFKELILKEYSLYSRIAF